MLPTWSLKSLFRFDNFKCQAESMWLFATTACDERRLVVQCGVTNLVVASGLFIGEEEEEEETVRNAKPGCESESEQDQ